MGYGEFGGGGSVNWTVAQGGNNNAKIDPANPKRAGGNDSAGNGKFSVYVNGVKVAEADVATSRVLVVWPGGPQPSSADQNVTMPTDGNIGHIAKPGGGSQAV